MARLAKVRVRRSAIPLIAAFVATALAGVSEAGTLAIGPVEQVNLKAASLTVLGQTYRIAPSTVIRDQSGALVTLGTLAPNTLVGIDGSENSAGKATVSSVTQLSQVDVPGATQLVVTGIVSSETATGQIRVGNLSIDINSALTGDTPNFAAGSLVRISGTQPNLGGLFLAQSIAAVNGIAGTGFTSNGIAGTGHSSNGIAGTGVSVKGIAGTGHFASGIAGTGHSSNGIAGTGSK